MACGPADVNGSPGQGVTLLTIVIAAGERGGLTRNLNLRGKIDVVEIDKQVDAAETREDRISYACLQLGSAKHMRVFRQLAVIYLDASIFWDEDELTAEIVDDNLRIIFQSRH